MTIFNEGRGKVIDVNPAPFARLIGLGVAAFLVVILLFNSVTTVQTGNVGVLTLFGAVSGPVLCREQNQFYLLDFFRAERTLQGRVRHQRRIRPQHHVPA